METTMLDYVLSRLDACDGEGTLKQVAKAADVPYTTVHRIATRYTRNPTVDSVQALYDYFKNHEKQAV